ncbi:MAG: ornithine cyclodeaminase family protein [Pseudomonadota bacterium]
MAKSQNLLYLSQQDVIDVAPTVAESVDIVEYALHEHGEKQVENPPKPGVHPLPRTFIHAMPALLRRKKQVGMKWVSGFSSNYERGLPNISGLIIMNDPETGIPTAIMDGVFVTAMRTAAASAVAARYLARSDSRVLSIVGAGIQGRYHLLTIKSTVPAIERVRVFDVIPETLERYVSEMGQYVDCEIEAADSIDDAIRDADILVSTAAKLRGQVVFKEDCIRPGALALPVHSLGWAPEAIRSADKLVVDDWHQLSSALIGPGKSYESFPEPHAELGEIIAGKKPGRETDIERIIGFNYGLAIEDVAMGSKILARAQAKGIGTQLKQLDGSLPYT